MTEGNLPSLKRRQQTKWATEDEDPKNWAAVERASAWVGSGKGTDTGSKVSRLHVRPVGGTVIEVALVVDQVRVHVEGNAMDKAENGPGEEVAEPEIAAAAAEEWESKLF